MTETVEYCLNNVDPATRRRLDDRETGTVAAKRCLQRCGDCYRESILVVDGELETAASHADLLPSLAESDE